MDDKEMNTMKELNLNEMELVNGGSAATTAARVIGAVGGPMLAVVGGPVCGLAFGVVAAACTIAAEVSDRKK